MAQSRRRMMFTTVGAILMLTALVLPASAASARAAASATRSFSTQYTFLFEVSFGSGVLVALLRGEERLRYDPQRQCHASRRHRQPPHAELPVVFLLAPERRVLNGPNGSVAFDYRNINWHGPLRAHVDEAHQPEGLDHI